MNNIQSQYLFYNNFTWQHVPVYLLPAKSPSHFSCGLEVSHKVLLISYKVKSTTVTVPSHNQSQPVQFVSCEFSIPHVLRLLPAKPWPYFAAALSVTQSITVCWKSIIFIFPPQITFQVANLQMWLALKTGYLASYCTCAKASMYYGYTNIL
jgi:hypothetical protein